MLKSRGFCRFRFTKNVDQFTIAFYPLRWLKSASLRLEKYLVVNQIGSETLNVMFLFLQSSEFKSTSQNASEGVRDLFILMDPVITNFHSVQSTITFFNNSKCCLPDSGNVSHHTKKLTHWRRNWLIIKYLIRPICRDFCCREGISCVNSNIKDSRDHSALFIGYL